MLTVSFPLAWLNGPIGANSLGRGRLLWILSLGSCRPMKVDHCRICGGTSPVTSLSDRTPTPSICFPGFRHMMHRSWSDTLGPQHESITLCALFRVKKRKLGRLNLGRSVRGSRRSSLGSDQHQSGSFSLLGGPWHHNWQRLERKAENTLCAGRFSLKSQRPFIVFTEF